MNIQHYTRLAENGYKEQELLINTKYLVAAFERTDGLTQIMLDGDVEFTITMKYADFTDSLFL